MYGRRKSANAGFYKLRICIHNADKLENIMGQAFYPQINIRSNLKKNEIEETIKEALGKTILLHQRMSISHTPEQKVKPRKAKLWAEYYRFCFLP